MAEKRFTIQGMRDYRGVQLPDIIEDLGELRDDLENAINEFKSYRIQAKEYAKRIDNTKELIASIDYLISLFTGHWEDLKRLTDELPQGVREPHIEILKQIHESCCYEQRTGYSTFKSSFISVRLKDESMRYLLLDKICSLYGDTAFKLLILADINTRLRTFIGDGLSDRKKTGRRLEKRDIPRIEMPPNTKWEDIKIAFLGREELQVYLNFKPFAAKTYIVLGFLDKRTSKGNDAKGKPNRLWLTLASFARCNGEIGWENVDFSVEDSLVKNVADLRKHLKALFGIDSSPITSYKRKSNPTYKARFTISNIDKKLFTSIAEWVRASQTYNTVREQEPDENS